MKLVLKASPVRGILESILIGVSITPVLLLLRYEIAPQIVVQGFLFLSGGCALIAALRVRLPGGGFLPLFRSEIPTALGLSMLFSAAVLGEIALFRSGLIFRRTLFGTTGMVVILLASGPVFLICRAVIKAWLGWNIRRRKKLHLSLTHAMMVVIASLLLMFAVFNTVVAFRSEAVNRFIPDNLAASIVVRMVVTILPALSIFVVITLLILILLFPPLTLFSYLVARRTTRRLQTLAEASRLLREGDTGIRVKIEGQDEAAQLQSDFNSMAARLESSFRELQDHRDRLEAAFRSRRNLMAGISHELRTPVTVLKTYLTKPGSGTGEIVLSAETAGVLILEIERLQSLIGDLSDLAAGNADQWTFNLQPVDAGDLIRKRIDAAAAAVWSTGRVKLIHDISPALPLIYADSSRLEQILINLIQNAVRHTPPGGIVAVAAFPEDCITCIEVRDTGEGIPPEDLPRIWELYYRGGRSAARDKQGSGLGLALVKQLTEAMTGSIEVSTRPGKGSVFSLRFPSA